LDSLLLALLLAALFSALGLLFLASLGLLVLLVVGVLAALASLAVSVVVVAVIIVAAVIVLIVLLDDLEVVLEGQGNQLVLELGAQVIIIVHKFAGILFGILTLLFVILLGLVLLTLGKLLLLRHCDSLEEVEEALLVDNLGDGLARLSLLCLLLLLDLLLGHILAIFPLDLGALALLNDVLASHHEALLQRRILKVIVLLKGEGQVEAVAGRVEVARDVLQVHQDWAVLLLDQAGDAPVVEHGAHPEPWHPEGRVLNVLYVASIDLNLGIILVIEELRAGLILSQEVGRGLLLSGKHQGALLVDLLVKAVVL
jgi:hypothetical protein